MRRVKLDRIDLQILKDLQEDGRMTNVELSRRAGISAPPCLRRVRALEEAGFIKGAGHDGRMILSVHGYKLIDGIHAEACSDVGTSEFGAAVAAKIPCHDLTPGYRI